MRYRRIAALVVFGLLAASVAGAGVRVGTPEVIDLLATYPSFPKDLVRVGGLGYFVANGNFGGSVVWRTDGTAAGTFAVSSLATSWDVLDTPTGPLAFYVGSGLGGPGETLVRNDGSSQGTLVLASGLRIEPWHAHVPQTGQLFFAANSQIWVTDGTPGGTREVADVTPGYMVAVGRRVLFLGLPGVWASDGTAEGTVQLPGFDETSALIKVGDSAFIFTQTPEGQELWKSDGTASGTSLVAKLPPGADVEQIAAAGGRLFFLASHGFPIKDLWASDGTAGGTVLLLQNVPPALMYEWADAWGGLVFPYEDGATGLEPWWSDGTRAGTHRIADVCPGLCNSRPQFPLAADGALVFLALGGLWATEGTPETTFRVVESLAVNGPGIALPGRLVFPGEELWSIPFEVIPEVPPPPAGNWITSPSLPGFRVKARITSGTDVRSVRKEPCIGETLCLSGAVPGRPELFVRVIGPRPNGYLWPNLVRFTTSQAQVWIEQIATGIVRYYRLDAVPRDSDELSGLVDRTGFRP
jgi:ELWxxDGT repeat protein